MVQTYGLTHINLAVRDMGRALRFYEQVFGLREYENGSVLSIDTDLIFHTVRPVGHVAPCPHL